MPGDFELKQIIQNNVPVGYYVDGFERSVRSSLARDFNDIGNRLTEIKAALAMVIAELEKVKREQEMTREMVRDIEAAKANPIFERFSNTVTRYQEIYDEAKHDFISNENEIQKDYDNTQLEVIDNFLNEAKTNTGSIDKLRDEYNEVLETANAMTEDMELMKGARNFSYVTRKLRLMNNKSAILQNLDGFMRLRMATAEMISNSQTMISVNVPTAVYIPFWVVGMTDSAGKETVFSLPVQELMMSEGRPTRDKPYAEHLFPSITGAARLLHHISAVQNRVALTDLPTLE